MIDKNKKRLYALVEGVVRETLDEMDLGRNESRAILENLENGIRNVEMLDEAKKKKKKKSASKKSDSKEKKTGKKKKGDSSELKNVRRQVLSMLNQDKFDMAAVARSVYPSMDDDARRSYVSRQARGIEPIPDNKVTSYYHALRSASKGRKGKVYEGSGRKTVKR